MKDPHKTMSWSLISWLEWKIQNEMDQSTDKNVALGKNSGLTVDA